MSDCIIPSKPSKEQVLTMLLSIIVYLRERGMSQEATQLSRFRDNIEECL